MAGAVAGGMTGPGSHRRMGAEGDASGWDNSSGQFGSSAKSRVWGERDKTSVRGLLRGI